VYREEAAQSGRELKWGESIALGGFVSVASDPGKAEKFVEPYRFAHAEWFTPFGFPRGLELVGDPDTISRQIETLHRALNFDEFFIWLNQGLAPHVHVLDNLELFASKVIPRFS
jgi:alkanesulfonate monooxygenase SsuD/methylene tetrahydromethanopterin reductase-like flavin-dependent oxidoreductase (luciferase family)